MNEKKNKKEKEKEYNNNDYNFILNVMNQQKNEFDKKLEMLMNMQEKNNNRVEKLYQIKKTKFKNKESQPIKILNEKPQEKKITDSIQSAIMNKILNQ